MFEDNSDVLVDALPHLVARVEVFVLVIVRRHDGVQARRPEREMRDMGRYALVPHESRRELERELRFGQRRRDHQSAGANPSANRLALDPAAVELDFERDRAWRAHGPLR